MVTVPLGLRLPFPGCVRVYFPPHRAQIFRRDALTVVDMPSLQKLIRANDWAHDPLAHGDACEQISCRADLEVAPELPDAFGALDAKATNSTLVCARWRCARRLLLLLLHAL